MTTLRLPNLKLTKWLVAGGTLLFMMALMLLIADRASAHGYVQSPGSRAYLCKTGDNTNCGPIMYEPQSLEAPKGFPAAGPADGKIASANGAFPELDAQSATRWTKVSMSPGTNNFTWTLTARHSTTNWKYYITKQNWDPNAPLTRDSFDLTPFCTVNYNGAQPPATYSDTCTVPNRTGYQVILAVWEIADTPNAFYNVIDVDFGGGSPGDPKPPVDTVPPTAPTGLQVSGTPASSAISLAWNASTDNVGVAGYRIYKGTTLAGTVSGTTLSYTVSGLTANTAYTFTVRAFDAAGNESSNSNAVTATTANGSAATPWAPNVSYTAGTLVSYNGATYECLQAHTSLTGWEPSNVPSLWLLK
ncbi:lytic polysaccharide monooxygenase [Paenibacillus sp.]|jgi:chitin-binding protein|uniref:lytic polysaccharide monooxygenase n=1 Tax=Paenibacillus sp. TaxID=58172 RepID=UPI00282E3A99|nr:lytic polysaccharide monooxygenase [Paenibacillus sp.]MDR0267417.1 lytic polysaccharide monooxygenase [Paenibacillus sp.]